MYEVMQATLTGNLGSLGQASYKLMRQHKFPHTYEEDEKICSADHDRCQMWDFEHAQRATKEHTGSGDMGIGRWAEHANSKDVMAFLKDILKVDEHYPDVVWTGFRVLGTVNRSNGYAVWSLELFAKNKDSKTEVYSGSNAPNVKLPEGCGITEFDYYKQW